jgi:hypothetical protein
MRWLIPSCFATTALAEEPPSPPPEQPAPAPDPAAASEAATVEVLRDAGITPAVIDETRGEDDDLGDQSIGAALGVAAGGRVTAGGIRITGHYLYQLSSEDWFDGIASFTFGGGDAACYRDRMDELVCEHDFADGGAVEIAAGVRRMLARRGDFRPFARAAIGIAVVRFGDDAVSGVVLPLHFGAGLRMHVARGVAVVGSADLAAGVGRYTRGLGLEPHFGLAVTAGAEFRLP